jgi:hypothetical protein
MKEPINVRKLTSDAWDAVSRIRSSIDNNPDCLRTTKPKDLLIARGDLDSLLSTAESCIESIEQAILKCDMDGEEKPEDVREIFRELTAGEYPA